MHQRLKTWQLLMLFLGLAACASAPKLNSERLYFFPNQADIFLQINVPAFRKLGKVVAKELLPTQEKAIKSGLNFTGQLAMFVDQRDFMLRAIGTYPKQLITNMLVKQLNILQLNEDIFTINLEQKPARLDNALAWQLYLPQNGEFYFSNRLLDELERIRRQEPITLPEVVRLALSSNRNAVLYLPEFSQFLTVNGIEDPLPVPIGGLLLEIDPKGSRYYVKAFALFSDDVVEQRKLVAQARFIVSTFANNKILRNLDHQIDEQGVLFSFDVKHKDIVRALKDLAKSRQALE